MTSDIRALAIKYVDEAIEDQRKLGYKGAVSPEAREKAIADAEAAFQELAGSTAYSKKAVAA